MLVHGVMTGQMNIIHGIEIVNFMFINIYKYKI